MREIWGGGGDVIRGGDDDDGGGGNVVISAFSCAEANDRRMWAFLAARRGFVDICFGQ